MNKEFKKVVRIGGGGGFADDRIDAALKLIEEGNLDYLSFDALSENELSAVAMKKLDDPTHPGYDRMLEYRMEKILPAALSHGVKIVSNMGSTNPVAAARYIVKKAAQLGYQDVKVAAVTGDDMTESFRTADYLTVEDGRPVRTFGENLVAANCYIPSGSLVDALRDRADIVCTGRIGDSAVFMAALQYEFGWAEDDWDKLAIGIMVGHEMECGGQMSGGNYVDPPYKNIDKGFDLGFPIAEVSEDGEVVFTKISGTGGKITVDTCIEQCLYEIHDPANYFHADVIVDLSAVEFEQIGPDRVRMSGVRGKPAPDTLKVAMGVKEGYFAAATVWVGGPGARARAEWIRSMLYARFDHLGFKPKALKIFLHGIDSMYGDAPGVPKDLDPWEVGIRVSCRTSDRKEAEDIMMESTSRLTTNGPSGVSCEHMCWNVRDVVAYYHTFIPRKDIHTKAHVFTAATA